MDAIAPKTPSSAKPEVIGSRRHFQQSLQERVDQLEAQVGQRLQQQHSVVAFYLHVLVQLVALSVAHLITTVSHKEITATQLIQRAVIEARREQNVLDAQIQSVRDMVLPESQP